MIFDNSKDQNKLNNIIVNKRAKFATSNEPVPRNTNYDKKLNNLNLNIQAISHLSNISNTNSKSPTGISNINRIYIPIGKRHHSNNNISNIN